MLDLTEAEFDDHAIDLHVYTGWSTVTMVVPRGVDVQILRHPEGRDQTSSARRARTARP